MLPISQMGAELAPKRPIPIKLHDKKEKMNMKKVNSKKENQKVIGNLAVKEEPAIRPAPDAEVVSALLAKPTEVNGAKFCALPTKMLDVDYTYQRPAKINEVRNIAASWDSTKAGAVLVNYRDGRLYIMDGQHRWEAAKQAGLPHLMCLVSIGLTHDEEADVFINQNVNTTRMTAYDRFYARCAKEADPFAQGMQALLISVSTSANKFKFD